MREFASVRGIDDPTSENASLVRAFFANLVAGLDRRHIKKRSVRHLAVVLYNCALDYLDLYGDPSASAADFSGLHVDWLLMTIGDILQRDVDSSHLMTRPGPVANHGGASAISLQPSKAFKYWLDHDLVDGLDDRDHSPAECMVLCEEFFNPGSRKPDAAVGARHNVVWLTPYVGPLSDLIDQCLKSPAYARQHLGVAQRLREVLGLIDRKPGDQVVLAWTAKSLDGMSRQRRAQLSAPTIFDSRGYRRFRHWPCRGSAAADEGFGRTYELDRNERARAKPSHGAPEIVRRQLQHGEIARMEYVGRVAPMHGETDAAFQVAAALDYAEEVSEGASTLELLIEVEAFLAAP